MLLDDIVGPMSIEEHIGKVKGGYRLYSHKGKNLGTFPSKGAAEKHEREVQYFKHADESTELNELDLLAPRSTYFKMGDGAWIKADYRGTQGLTGHTSNDATAFSSFEWVPPQTANSLGLEKQLNAPQASGTVGPNQIVPDTNIQGNGPLSTRSSNVVDFTTAKSDAIPASLKSKLVNWVHANPPKSAPAPAPATTPPSQQVAQNQQQQGVGENIVAGIVGHEIKKFLDEPNPSSTESHNVDEGVNDQHIFKCIFLFGPMGAGKSTVARPLLSHTGLRSVNLDNFNEMFIKKGQVPTGHLSPDQLEKSWQLSQTQQTNFIDGRMGVIIDGSGRNPDTAISVIEKMMPLGYEFMMIFVNVSEATSIARQQSRADKQQQQWGVGRQVDPTVAKNTYAQVQQNLKRYEAYFGAQRFVYVDNENTPDLSQATKKVDAFLRAPITQPEAIKWVQAQKGGQQVAQQQQKLATAQDRQQQARKQYMKNPFRPASVKQGMAEGGSDQVKKIVKQHGKPIGEIGIDPEASPGNGCWYVKHYASGYDVVGFDSQDEAFEELKYVAKQDVAEGEHDAEFINDEDAWYNMADFARKEMSRGQSMADVIGYLVDNNYLLRHEVGNFTKTLRGEKWNESVAEGGYSNYDNNRTGFRKPGADVSGEGEPQGMFMVVINGRDWKEFTSNKAFTVAKTVASKNPTKQVQVRWPTGQLNTVKEGMSESDISGLMAAGRLHKEFIVKTDTKSYRVQAQSANVAKEKVIKKIPGATIVSVTEKNTETTLQENESDAVYGAILRRIMGAHLSLLSKYGPEAVMNATEEVADWVGDVDEIGTSDVSGWVRDVFNKLQAEYPVAEDSWHAEDNAWHGGGNEAVDAWHGQSSAGPMAETEQTQKQTPKTVAKTWDQMTPKEKLSGVKGRTMYNQKTSKYYVVFDVPATGK
jgi:adenylate kinase family enzyme